MIIRCTKSLIEYRPLIVYGQSMTVYGHSLTVYGQSSMTI